MLELLPRCGGVDPNAVVVEELEVVAGRRRICVAAATDRWWICVAASTRFSPTLHPLSVISLIFVSSHRWRQ
jgi:hypothetical protein